MSTVDRWASVPESAPDAIFALNDKAKAAKGPSANLVVGAYRDENGKPYPLQVIRKAERKLLEMDTGYEYLPIIGFGPFIDASVKLAYGDSVRREEVVAAQTISGTGAIAIGAHLLAMVFDVKQTPVYISDPTWPNHRTIFESAGWTNVKTYRYYSPATRGLDFDGLKADVEAAPAGSIFLLHQCAHNPTGVDPTHEQWAELADVFAAKGHQVFFDSAYQGYASGNLDYDAFALRLFIKKGLQVMVAQSYSKNLGLYGERAGCLSVMLKDLSKANAVKTAIEHIIRAQYSNPPAHGARLAHLVLSDPDLRKEWQEELTHMSGRIKEMRRLVYTALKDLKTPGTWEHVVNQIGMFSYLGLTKEQCKYCQDHNVFITLTGRANMAGLTVETAKMLAETIHAAVTQSSKI